MENDNPITFDNLLEDIEEMRKPSERTFLDIWLDWYWNEYHKRCKEDI